MTEIWKDIPGYEGHYQASSEGGVRSLETYTRTHHGGLKRQPGKVLRGRLSSRGYLTYKLANEGKQNTKQGHNLVAASFIGAKPLNHIANHKNGIKTDNRAINLEWVTQSDNMQHAYDTGLSKRIPRKLTAEKVLNIIAGLRSKQSVASLAREYGVCTGTIGDIKRGRIWSHVTLIGSAD